MSIKISIIVPVYNAEKILHRCVNSIINQSYKDWELLLVDDGSIDRSALICDDYVKQDKRIKVFHKQNGGVSSARNSGIKLAKGDWIIFLDSDDYLLQDALEILLDTALSNNTNVSAANFFVEVSNKRYGFCEGRNRIVRNNFRSWYFNSFSIRAGSALFNTGIIKSYKFDNNLYRYEDVKFWFDVMRTEKIAYSSDYVMVYSEDNLGLSHKSKSINKDYTFCLDFVDKSFWETLSLAVILKQGIALYPEHKQLLKSKYRKIWYFLYLDKILSVLSRIRIRFIRLIRKFKRFFYKKK